MNDGFCMARDRILVSLVMMSRHFLRICLQLSRPECEDGFCRKSGLDFLLTLLPTIAEMI
jgi:hypothetical protein